MDKKNIQSCCTVFVSGKIESLQNAIANIREAISNETKSSAGDKHETSRAMAQNELERLGTQLQQLEKQRQQLIQADPDKSAAKAEQGAYLETTAGNFYICTGLGKIENKSHTFFAVSLQSPVGQELAGKRAGDEFLFGGKPHRITAVY